VKGGLQEGGEMTSDNSIRLAAIMQVLLVLGRLEHTKGDSPNDAQEKYAAALAELIGLVEDGLRWRRMKAGTTWPEETKVGGTEGDFDIPSTWKINN
jgi:hypothetical protein